MAEFWASIFPPQLNQAANNGNSNKAAAAAVMAGVGGITYPLPALQQAQLSAPSAFWMAGPGDEEAADDGNSSSSSDDGGVEGMPTLPIPTPAVFQTLRPLGSVLASSSSSVLPRQQEEQAEAEAEAAVLDASSGPPLPENDDDDEEEDEDEEGGESMYYEEMVGEVAVQVKRHTQQEAEAEAEQKQEQEQEELRRYKLRSLVLQDELQRTRRALEEQGLACRTAQQEARAFEELAVAREEEMAQTRKVGGQMGRWVGICPCRAGLMK